MPTSVTDIWPWWSQSVSRWCDILSPMIIPSLHSYAPWCPACQHLQNDWEGFAELSEALDISVGKVDVTRQPGMWKLSNTTIVTLTHYSAFVCACYCCGKRPGRACARMNPSAVVFTVFHIIQLCRQGHICKKDENMCWTTISNCAFSAGYPLTCLVTGHVKVHQYSKHVEWRWITNLGCLQTWSQLQKC